MLQTAAVMSDCVIKAGPVPTAHTSKHNFTPSELVWHGPLPSRSQSRRFCRPAAAMSGPLLKTAAATTVDTPEHHFKPLQLVFGLSTTLQTSVRKCFNKQQQQTPVQFCAQDMSSNSTSNNHSWHPKKQQKSSFSPSKLCAGWSVAIPDLKLEGSEERQRPFLTFAQHAICDRTRSQSWPLKTEFQALKTWICILDLHGQLPSRSQV